MTATTIRPEQENQAAWNELRPVLHDEVNRLPDKYRLPVILSYLEGRTNEEVATLLDWPVGTVKGRLSRARDMLRSPWSAAAWPSRRRSSARLSRRAPSSPRSSPSR